MNHAAAEPDAAYDLIGIGFGPSNLALAIALEEMSETHGHALKTLFIEKQQHYGWHGDTLIDRSGLQISFLKDLVSLRNPTSRYSFVNYLHQHGRLVDFINMATFYPCRMEYDDYLRWVARQFAGQVHYGEAALRVDPESNGRAIEQLRVRTRDHHGAEKSYRARSVVIAAGGTPNIPSLFASLNRDPRVFHHSTYLSSVRRLNVPKDGPLRAAIIGGGQSAAEAFVDLNDRFPASRLDMILRVSTLKPADDSPFVNEIFAPEYVDQVFERRADDRQQFIQDHRNTNYSVVDRELIEQIYGILYRQKVLKHERHAVLGRQRVQAVLATADGIALTLMDTTTGLAQTRVYDLVVLATGYERRAHFEFLEPLKCHLRDFRVDRDYRLIPEDTLSAPIFLQGFCEATHGLSDTLLSVLPKRAEEIGAALYRSLSGNQALSGNQSQTGGTEREHRHERPTLMNA